MIETFTDGENIQASFGTSAKGFFFLVKDLDTERMLLRIDSKDRKPCEDRVNEFKQKAIK